MNKLQASPERANYALGDSHDKLQINYGLGSRFRRNLFNTYRLVTVNWVASRSTYSFLAQAYRAFINSGGAPFLMDLLIDTTDLTEYECEFVTGSFKLDRVSALTFYVSATIRVRPIDFDVTSVSWVTDSGLNRILLSVLTGNYSVLGQSINFRLSVIHANVTTGSYILAGPPIAFSVIAAPPNLNETGIFVYTGQPVTLSRDRVIKCDYGSYAMTGETLGTGEPRGLRDDGGYELRDDGGFELRSE